MTVLAQQAEQPKDGLAKGLLAPGAVVRGFRILRVLRAGQSNNVYVAVSPAGVEVAIKEYFPRRLARRLPSGRIGVATEEIKAQFEKGVRGFVGEAIALAEIKSELLARYVAAFKEHGTAYIITELVPGETLESWARRKIRTERRPEESELRLIFWALLHGLQVMHDRGFLHLDLKPSNVILADEQTPILIDLGGARRFPFNAAHAAVSVSNFTPGFAAPEQHVDRAELFCPATDIYGIGTSILYCMTGRVPPTAAERMKADQLGEHIARARAAYSAQLVAVVEQCVALPLDRRAASVKQLQIEIAAQ